MTAFFDIFLYLKNNDSVEHGKKLSWLRYLFISTFWRCIWSIWLVNFFFSLVLLIYSLKSKFATISVVGFWNRKSVKLQILHQPSVPLKIPTLNFFSSNIIHSSQTEPITVQTLRLLSVLVKIHWILHVNFEMIRQFLFKFGIALHYHDT